ncbi:recombinase family protein [Candidatus Nitronereus thalassa]|uniref:Recombinase family protein n=1 Tax=Candidatus Nitronereus thalassa TaxID=3020898 RepID=A0ABU3K354_9BACT|nr:recombinase family protein [Candidatus Nitronereus thalassa]MDT7040794.1 recombinase family protein [Candidatus Nitronereus thalassa]
MTTRNAKRTTSQKSAKDQTHRKPPRLWCAVYTRKSSEEGLDQAFNSLDAQREAGEAYVKSQAPEGWCLCTTRYDDGGYSGGTLERPGVQHLLTDIQAKRIQIVVVYKVDRLTRSLRDFAKLVDLFDTHGVSFASVTQPVNTTTSTGRLMLNVLLSFAQFEREVTGERIRDKVLASKQKGLWMGGFPALGYDIQERTLVVNEAEAEVVRHIYEKYVALGSVGVLRKELEAKGYRSKRYQCRGGQIVGGGTFSRGHLYRILQNRLYRGEIEHKGQIYPGAHHAIIDERLWEKTQALLESHRQEFLTDARVASPSLLKGLLYDDVGNRMSPSHGRKGSRRYHYYISQAVLQYREHEAGSVARLPSHELEQLVNNQVIGTLTKEDGSQELAKRLVRMSDQEQCQVLRRIIQKVVVSRNKVRITLNLTGGLSLLDLTQDINNEEDAHPLQLEVPFTLVPRGGKHHILVNGSGDGVNAKPNAVLVRAVVRGYHWREQLLTGSNISLKQFAKEQAVKARYMMRLLRVSFLAPDIIEAILNGTQPVTMTLERFRRPIPLDWATQRQLFGFPPR